MMSTKWNNNTTSNKTDNSRQHDSSGCGGESILSIPDSLREEFRNLCTARTRNIKFVLKALENTAATATTKEKKIDPEVEGTKKKKTAKIRTTAKRSVSVSEEESGEESSPAMSDGEEDSVVRYS